MSPTKWRRRWRAIPLSAVRRIIRGLRLVCAGKHLRKEGGIGLHMEMAFCMGFVMTSKGVTVGRQLVHRGGLPRATFVSAPDLPGARTTLSPAGASRVATALRLRVERA